MGSLASALALGRLETFNSDQGGRFAGEAFTGALTEAGVRISMDGRGRALDNVFVERLWRSVKYEEVSLRGYGTPGTPEDAHKVRNVNPKRGRESFSEFAAMRNVNEPAD